MAEKKPPVPTRSTFQKDTDSTKEFKGGGKGILVKRGATKTSATKTARGGK